LRAAGARGLASRPAPRRPRCSRGLAHGLLTGFAAAVVALAAAGCGPEAPETIDREVFVQTYVALREAELRSPGAVIPDAARDSILGEKGVSDEDLVAFAEVHGGDPVFMEGVWTEIQNRIIELSSGTDAER